MMSWKSAEEAPHKSIWWLLLLLGLAALAGAVWLQHTPLPPVPPPPPPPIPPTQTNPPIPQVEHTNPPPPSDPGSFGWLGVHILKNSLSHGWQWPIHCKIEGGNQTLETNLAGDDNQFRLQPGNYSVILTHSAQPNWHLVGAPTKINGNETNTLNFTFFYADLKVESDPPGALVNWPSSATSIPGRPMISLPLPFGSVPVPFPLLPACAAITTPVARIIFIPILTVKATWYSRSD